MSAAVAIGVLVAGVAFIALIGTGFYFSIRYWRKVEYWRLLVNVFESVGYRRPQGLARSMIPGLFAGVGVIIAASPVWVGAWQILFGSTTSRGETGSPVPPGDGWLYVIVVGFSLMVAMMPLGLTAAFWSWPRLTVPQALRHAGR